MVMPRAGEFIPRSCLTRSINRTSAWARLPTPNAATADAKTRERNFMARTPQRAAGAAFRSGFSQSVPVDSMTWRRFFRVDRYALTFRRAAKKAARGGLFYNTNQRLISALTRLEARIALADHEHFAATTHDFAVAVALFCGLQRRQDFHGRTQSGLCEAAHCKALREKGKLPLSGLCPA